MDELWGHCPRCDQWFLIDDPSLDALYLCPDDLARADDFRPKILQRPRRD